MPQPPKFVPRNKTGSPFSLTICSPWVFKKESGCVFSAGTAANAVTLKRTSKQARNGGNTCFVSCFINSPLRFDHVIMTNVSFWIIRRLNHLKPELFVKTDIVFILRFQPETISKL